MLLRRSLATAPAPRRLALAFGRLPLTASLSAFCMPAYLNEERDRHDWQVSDHRVTAIIFDLSSIRLQSWTLSASIEVRLGVPFDLSAAGHTYRIDPEQPATGAPLLPLLGSEVHQLSVRRTGEMTLHLDDHVSIEVEPHAEYEAWEAEFTGPFARSGYLCGPGGGSPWGR
jgi:hypothetical protein